MGTGPKKLLFISNLQFYRVYRSYVVSLLGKGQGIVYRSNLDYFRGIQFVAIRLGSSFRIFRGQNR